jgi:hypothetical protein
MATGNSSQSNPKGSSGGQSTGGQKPDAVDPKLIGTSWRGTEQPPGHRKPPANDTGGQKND